MAYSKNSNNTYAKNNSVSYNRSVLYPVKRIYTNNNPDSLPVKNTVGLENKFNHLLTGGNATGNVWVNNSYNITVEDPGLSWTL